MFLWVRLVIFTLEDLDYESDLHEAMETLPVDLETVYIRPSLESLDVMLIEYLKVREDTLTPLWQREDNQPTYYHTNSAVDVSRQASFEKV